MKQYDMCSYLLAFRLCFRNYLQIFNVEYICMYFLYKQFYLNFIFSAFTFISLLLLFWFFYKVSIDISLKSFRKFRKFDSLMTPKTCISRRKQANKCFKSSQ